MKSIRSTAGTVHPFKAPGVPHGPNRSMVASGPDASPKAHPDFHKKTTSHKLDWLKALGHDKRVKPWTFEVGFCLIGFRNNEKGTAYVSDETLADDTGINLRTVRRARERLRQTGWIRWKRTRTCNIYEFLDTNVNAMMDSMILKRDQRKERRETIRHHMSSPDRTGRSNA